MNLLKAYWGEAATAENDYCFDYLPKITGDHGTYRTVLDMIDGKVKGYFLLGQNPAVGSAHGKAQRLGMANLDWLVVRDLFEIESATFWKDSPEIETGEIVPEECRTEVFLMPAASHVEKEGTFTQTQRMLQWREKAVEPPGDCRSELWFFYHLGRMRPGAVGRLHARSGTGRCWTSPGTTPSTGETEDPSAEAVLMEINGYEIASGRPLSTFTEMKDDGSTLGGCWIYTGVYKDGVEPGRAAQARQRAELRGAGVGLGLAGQPAHALQPRVGRPRGQAVERAQGLRVVGPRARRERRVDRARRPGLRADQAAVVPRARGHRRGGRHRGHGPVHHAGRREGLALRAQGPHRRAAAHALRAGRVAVPQPDVRPAVEPDAQGVRRAPTTG